MKLKEMVLRAVLNKEALPGSDQPLMFPDLALLFSQPEIYLADNDIRDLAHLKPLDKRVRIVNEEFLKEEARKNGQVYFLVIGVKEEGSVMISIELKVMASSDMQAYVLSSMLLKMESVDGRWKSIGDATSLSA